MPSFLCGILHITLFSECTFYAYSFLGSKMPRTLVIYLKGHTRSHSEHGS